MNYFPFVSVFTLRVSITTHTMCSTFDPSGTEAPPQKQAEAVAIPKPSQDHRQRKQATETEHDPNTIHPAPIRTKDRCKAASNPHKTSEHNQRSREEGQKDNRQEAPQHIQPSRQPPALTRSGGTETRPKPRTEGSRATDRTQGSEQGSRTATEGSTTSQDTTNRAPTRNTDTKNRQTVWQRVNTSERSEDRHNRRTRAEEEQHTHHTNKAARGKARQSQQGQHHDTRGVKAGINQGRPTANNTDVEVKQHPQRPI